VGRSGHDEVGRGTCRVGEGRVASVIDRGSARFVVVDRNRPEGSAFGRVRLSIFVRIGGRRCVIEMALESCLARIWVPREGLMPATVLVSSPYLRRFLVPVLCVVQEARQLTRDTFPRRNRCGAVTYYMYPPSS
jgi:hypothetical protein